MSTVASPALIAPTTRYEILELLGRGGMGEVYRAVDRELDVTVALKSLRARHADDPVILARFRREARLARRIKHVNVAQVYDLVEIGGTRYLAMEYVEGRSLRQLIDTKGALPLHVALAVMRQACGGVQAAHDAGVIHRDLKPHNVMLARRDGRAMILDFGIAREVGGSEDTETGVVLGSPQYMSYEQLAGTAIGPLSDVYQLGILLYEMTTGISPFRAPGLSPSSLRALREVPPDPRQRARVPDFVAETVLACLARRPEERPQSAEEMAARLMQGAPADPAPVETEASDAAGTESAPVILGAVPAVLLAAPPSRERDAMAERLRRLGCTVVPCDDGRKALDAAHGRRFSLAILASALAEVDGLTACQLLARQTPGGPVPTLLLLPGGDQGGEAFARQAGAADVVHLPLNIHAFARSVRHLLHG